MPSRLQRLSYPWTTGTIACLVVLGAGVYLTKRLVPPPEANRLAGEPGEFLVRGVNQSIDWNPVGNDAFRQARRLNKPIFLTLGAAWSRAGRLTDVSAFQTKEVREQLRQEFVCIRVDLSENPEWGEVFLPLSRSDGYFDPSIQIHILDPTGKLITSVLRRSADERIDGTAVLEAMRRTRETLDNLRDPAALVDPPGALQAQEAQVLLRPQGRSEPDFEAHLEFVRRSTHPIWGGQPRGQMQTLSIPAWRYLLAMGDLEALQSSLEPALLSPIVDWIDGGFFRQAASLDWRSVETDKLASQNAAMASFLARWYRVSRSPLARELALRTFDSFAQQFWIDDSFATARLGDEGMMERSQRLSVSVKRIRQEFEPAERTWLRDSLGLRVETNPQMLPFLTSPEVLTRDPEKFEEMLERLQPPDDGTPNYFVGRRYLDVNGSVVARLIETARLLDSPERFVEAMKFFQALNRYRVGDNDILHSATFGSKDHRVLDDYLSYADACLQAYVATGRSEWALDGFKVLQRGLFVFQGPQSGIWITAKFDHLDPSPPDLAVPSIVDVPRESVTAKAIRLCFQYGCLFRSLDNQGELAQAGERVYQMARSSVGVYSSLANQLQNGFSSFFHAALLTRDDYYAVTTGPDRLGLALALFQRAPHRLVIPASDLVRPILASRLPGIYLMRGNSASGPYTLDEATRALQQPCRPSPR
ncbi:MAG TPA: DUF255 domain-containing protein [Fimbriimonadaceae bacterium]|nr:DUF255 domain-containing protein [Fimbriimonadaceae bacterium]HRJ33854.1 DUF255 domain-containing protein [Fimbriimonadaceae bacterium]